MPPALSKRVYIVGTCDTKHDELTFIQHEIQSHGMSTKMVDLSAKRCNASRQVSPADVAPEEVAQYHPNGLSLDAIFCDDRGEAIAQILRAFECYIRVQKDIAGIIGIGGSGGTALISPGLRALPIGLPKLLLSTVVNGNVSQYSGASDIALMYSVTDIAGLNSISRPILANAANAVAGMASHTDQEPFDRKILNPTVTLTMFGVTTPCVQGVIDTLKPNYECLVFHATGSGGQSMERLVADGKVTAVLDLTTTEIADLIAGGIFSALPCRLDAIIQRGIPYIGSCGALDIVNFGPKDSVPTCYRSRKLYAHNPQITLMRTNADEAKLIGGFIADKLNQSIGPVRFLIPEFGMSSLSVKDGVFYAPEVDAILFETLEKHFIETSERQLIRVKACINSPKFIDCVLTHFYEIEH